MLVVPGLFAIIDVELVPLACPVGTAKALRELFVMAVRWEDRDLVSEDETAVVSETATGVKDVGNGWTEGFPSVSRDVTIVWHEFI